MGVPGSPKCESVGGFQAFLYTRGVSKAATWGCQIQLGSLRRSLIILESFLETIFQQLLLLNSLPPSPSFIVKSGAGVLFLGSA